MKKLLTGLAVVFVLGSISYTANTFDSLSHKHEHGPASFGSVESKHEH
ncbi:MULTISPECIES: hypothetical protein [Bacillaceae]|nr:MULTISPECIES: hypothetical protein [Bacillaceae]